MLSDNGSGIQRGAGKLREFVRKNRIAVAARAGLQLRP